MNLIGDTANSLWQVIAVGLLLGAGLLHRGTQEADA